MSVNRRFENKGPTLGMRHMQTLLIFLNITVIYISRQNISIAVIAMTNAETSNPDYPEFDWTEKEISYILSSFYWGSVLTQLLGGALSKRFGAKITMGLSTALSAILSAITPWCVGWGSWQAFCVIRVLQGLFQGTLFPCIYEHLAKWAPVQERNRLGALSNTGIAFGNIMAMFITGIIAEGPLGWPGISYVSAGMCFAWCLLWWIFSSNNATESRFISEAEMVYIESSMEHRKDFHKTKIPVPWKAIFLSVPFYALLVTACAQSWGLGTLQAQIPSYLNGVLDMNIKDNGLFSALPFLAMWGMSYVYVLVADLLLRKNILSLTFLRRCINSVAFLTPAVGLIAIGFLDKDSTTLAISLMTISVGVNSGSTIGSTLNIIDLSPNHAGHLMGILNTIAHFMPLIGPLVVGVIVMDTSNRSQWQIVFIIAAIVFFFGNLVYIVFGSVHTQPWDAEDFLVPKDSETSKNSNRKDSQITADVPVKAIENSRSNTQTNGPCLGMRHMQSLLLFLQIVVVITSRSNVTIAVVAMTNLKSSNPNFPVCVHTTHSFSNQPPQEKFFRINFKLAIFDWNRSEISYIYSSFFWGTTLTQLVGAAISKNFGSKLTLGFTTLAIGLLSAITPWSIGWGDWKAYCCIRLMQGLFQGMTFPAIHQHLAKWCPVEERIRLSSFSYTGIDSGSVLALYMSGMIAASPLGWPGISHISALLCFIWFILWMIFGANNSTESKSISESERLYIEASLEHSNDFHKKKIPTPWKAILTSVPFYAFCFARVSDIWNYFTILNQISSYLNGVLELDLENNALFSSLPFFVMWGLSYVFIAVADVILNRNILTLTALRKTFNTIAHCVPVFTSIALGFLAKDQSHLVLIVLVIHMSVAGGTTIGSTLNTIDLSPNHAGTLMGISNTVTNFVALANPLVVGAIVTDTHNRSQWQIAFITSAIVLFLGNVIYVIWGKCTIQPWDDKDYLVKRKSKNILRNTSV